MIEKRRRLQDTYQIFEIDISQKCEILLFRDFGINKNKETSYFKQVDNLMKHKYLSKFSRNSSNRELIQIIEDREFIRNDKSIVLNPENLKIYL